MSAGRNNNDDSGGLILRPGVNIYSYCSTNEQAHHPDDHLAVEPDLHGNTHKLIDFLIREGFIDVEEEDCLTLLQIYKRSQKLSVKDLCLYKECLSRVLLKAFHHALLLIGDEIKDRGNNDHLTFILFDVLREIGLLMRILISNHADQFLKQYVAGIVGPIVTQFCGANQSYGQSFYGLRNDIINDLVSEAEIEAILQRSYFPTLLLLSCHVVSDTRIRLYTHAPVTPTKLKDLGELFGVVVKMGTVYEFETSVQQMNAAFRKIFSSKESLKLFYACHQVGSRKWHIWEDFLNDRYSELRPDSTELSFRVENIHGHVAGEKPPSIELVKNWQYVNLDSLLGMRFEGSDHETSRYAFYLSHEPKLVATLKAEQGTRDREALNVERRAQRALYHVKKEQEKSKKAELMIKMIDVIEAYLKTHTWRVKRLFEEMSVNLTTDKAAECRFAG